MATYVLVHGAWHGGWCWRDVVPALCAAGHRVLAPSLSGLGEHAHRAHPAIGLDDHVRDLVALFEIEGLEDAVLVGHSYAGSVITGVADAFGDDARRRIARLDYLDAQVPPDDATHWRWADGHSPEQRAGRLAAIAGPGKGDWLLPPPAAAFGLSDPAQLAFVGPRLRPMPAATYTVGIALRGVAAGVPRRHLWATEPVYETLRPTAERVRAAPGWRCATLATGHDLMVSAPQALARWLLEPA